MHYHDQQKRKGGIQEPYSSHPFAVRDILVRYGYDEPEVQAIALLHDVFEDTKLGSDRDEIMKRFGDVVHQGVFVLSTNTPGRFAGEITPLFDNLGIKYLGEDSRLTPEAYKTRLLFARTSIKRVKIADVIHNTRDLSSLNKSGIQRKLDDADKFYIPLGNSVAPIMVKELVTNVSTYRASDHYRSTFST